MSCFIVVANQPLICHYVFPCIRHSGSNIRRILEHKRKDRTPRHSLATDSSQGNNWSWLWEYLSEHNEKESSCTGGGGGGGGKVTKSRANRESKTGKWVWPSRVWKQQLGPWWQSGLWEFKSRGSEVGVSLRRGPGQEGRLWLSKRPQLYLYYIFSSPGLFQREKRVVFRFPICVGLCLLFPCSVSVNVFISGATFGRAPACEALCLLLKDTVTVLLLHVERVMGGCVIVLPHLFSREIQNQRRDGVKEQWRRGLGTTVWWKVQSQHHRDVKSFCWK